jgi:hypothetical protein
MLFPRLPIVLLYRGLRRAHPMRLEPRVYVKKLHRELSTPFDHSKLNHRSDQEARNWAEETHMGDDGYEE